MDEAGRTPQASRRRPSVGEAGECGARERASKQSGRSRCGSLGAQVKRPEFEAGAGPGGGGSKKREGFPAREAS